MPKKMKSFRCLTPPNFDSGAEVAGYDDAVFLAEAERYARECIEEAHRVCATPLLGGGSVWQTLLSAIQTCRELSLKRDKLMVAEIRVSMVGYRAIMSEVCPNKVVYHKDGDQDKICGISLRIDDQIFPELFHFSVREFIE